MHFVLWMVLLMRALHRITQYNTHTHTRAVIWRIVKSAIRRAKWRRQNQNAKWNQSMRMYIIRFFDYCLHYTYLRCMEHWWSLHTTYGCDCCESHHKIVVHAPSTRSFNFWQMWATEWKNETEGISYTHRMNVNIILNVMPGCVAVHFWIYCLFLPEKKTSLVDKTRRKHSQTQK